MKIDVSIDNKIEQALLEVKKIVVSDGNESEISYLAHLPRYKTDLCRIMQLLPNGGRILDVGSHYLHQSLALKLLGYEVIGMDVGVFSGQAYIRDRAIHYDIDNHVVDDFSAGNFLNSFSGSFDLIVFTEILEHITFNPVCFWLRIYELMKIGSFVYITTPNSLTPWKMLSVLKNLFIFRGIGLSVNAIFKTVTYGHHWKEYSSAEIKNYFALLSPDFSVSISYYEYRPRQPWSMSLKNNAEKMIRWLSSLVPAFREELEVVVHLRSKTSWLMDPTKLGY